MEWVVEKVFQKRARSRMYVIVDLNLHRKVHGACQGVGGQYLCTFFDIIQS